MATKTQIWLLRDGARHPDGVIKPGGRTSFEQSGQRVAVAGLLAQGLIEPNAHGDYYITDSGRRALAHATTAKGPEKGSADR